MGCNSSSIAPESQCDPEFHRPNMASVKDAFSKVDTNESGKLDVKEM